MPAQGRPPPRVPQTAGPLPQPPTTDLPNVGKETNPGRQILQYFSPRPMYFATKNLTYS